MHERALIVCDRRQFGVRAVVAQSNADAGERALLGIDDGAADGAARLLCASSSGEKAAAIAASVNSIARASLWRDR